jgi:hypothetical protein
MSIIAPQIEAYLFVDLPGTRKIEIKDSGAVTVSLTLSATAPLSEALQDWQDQANAHPSLNGTYSFGWIPAEQKVRFVATEIFDLDLFGSLPEALGFSVAGWSGAQNYGSDLTPKIVCNPISLDYTPPRVAEEEELRQYSWGRVSSHTHYKARVSRVSVVMRTEQADDVLRGPLLAGRARYYPCGYTSGAWSSSNLRGYLDVSPYQHTDKERRGPSDNRSVITLVGMVSDFVDAPAIGWARIAGALRYHWGICWATKHEGVPYVFSAYLPPGSVDPPGYVVDPSLVVERSSKLGAVVDPKTGVAKSYDLTYTLLRTGATQALIRRPVAGQVYSLASDLAWDEVNTIEVNEDLSGAPSSGSVSIGRETIGYAFLDAVSTPNAFKGLTRGSPNSEWRAYDHDAGSGIATWITTVPLLWRGRLVELYAVPVDPFGNTHGSHLLSDAAMVWRGHVDRTPVGVEDGWILTARSQERRLAEPFGQEASGQARWEVIADPAVPVDPEWAWTITIEFKDTGVTVAETLTIRPFTAYTYGDKIQASQLRADIQAEWKVVASALSVPSQAYISDELQWQPDDEWLVWEGALVRVWRAQILASTAKASGNLIITHTISGYVPGLQLAAAATFVPANAVQKWVTMPLGMSTAASSVGNMLIQLDEGLVDALPEEGIVLFELEDQEHRFRYEAVEVVGDGSNSAHLIPAPGQAGLLQWAETAIAGEENSWFDATFIRQLGPGSPRELMLRAIMSSGRGDNDPTYDTEPSGTGLDLDAVDTASIFSELDGHWAATLTEQSCSLDDAIPWSRLWGGLIGLAGRCAVSKPRADGSAVEIAIVQTSLADSGLADAVITDEHILTVGAASQTVKPVAVDVPPNYVRVKLLGQGGEKDGSIVVVDNVADRTEGRKKLDLKSYGLDHQAVHAAVGSWAASAFEEGRFARRFQLMVVPWLARTDGSPIDVGNAVRLSSNHFRLWDAFDGSPGYDGPARVVGRQVGPDDFATTLLLELPGLYIQHSLAPSADVVSWAGTAAAPTIIRVAEDYAPLMSAFLASGGASFDLVAYLPSADDATTDGYTITAVDVVGGLTELTVGAIIGAPVLTTDWQLTIPVRGSANEAQKKHLHADTPGAAWR